MPKPKKESELLKGWQQIATFLGLPISAAQRWAKSGMPVTHVGRREVGVLGERVLVPAADFIQRALAHAGHSPAVLRHKMQMDARLLIDLISSRTLQVQQTCE